MADRRKVWLGVGLFALAGTSVAVPAAPSLATGIAADHAASGTASPTSKAVPPALLLAEGGEGGEAGAGVPESYALPSADPDQYQYDAAPEIAAYVAGVHATYATAAAEAHKLGAAIDGLLANPSEATLAAARKAWVAARPAYLVTETYRFYDGPIEAIEGRINAWPLDEAFIDYVVGKENAGIVNDPSIPVTIRDIDDRDQVGDEDQVTTGWHAIEFLLWGQDLYADSPGRRPATDYVAGQGNNDRRRLYLKLVTEQLISDLESLAAAWEPGKTGSYAVTFAALPEREAIGRILNGMAVLAGSELMSERMAVGLDSGDQEDEHSCFSDTTHQDFVYDVKGIADVWNGTYAGAEGPGIKALVEKVDPATAAEVSALIADTTAKIAKLGDPWDQVLASPPNSPARQDAEDAVSALQALGEGIKRAGGKLGVLVQIPSG